ncbi:hypothetical protein BC332_12290 [Capsicum chinense]|nr:hypothetical protein BC332_12290 [Capsicum chinense]
MGRQGVQAWRRPKIDQVVPERLGSIPMWSVWDRKALRALKGLVKLHALVRGFLVRKRAAANLHSMKALISAQAAVRSQ